MFKKTLIASALALASLASFAADYYVVTPAPGKESTANIVVTLNAATLPNAKVNKAFSYDLNQALQVTGDSAFDSAGVSWTLANGTTTPPGLTLGSNGVVSGTPTTKNTNGQSFDVVATYKTKTGQQAYTIVVNGASLDVVSIAAGQMFTCAVTTAGGAKCWGYNYSGQLGNGTNTNTTTPAAVSGLSSGVVTVSAGMDHVCALTTAGSVKCWGANSNSQLGNGTTTNSNVPVSVSGLTGVASISAGMQHNCAVTTAGGAKCWGRNDAGQLGDGTSANSSVPVTVSGLNSGVATVDAGRLHTCAVTTAGGAKCWGYNPNGQLGNGTTTDSRVPVDVTGLTSGVASLSAGKSDDNVCAVTTAGGAKCWGYNGYGSLGNGTTTNSTLPVAVSGLTSGVASISVGGAHTCAVTTAGGAKCWGANYYGSLGNGTTTSSNVPVNVTGLTSGVETISAGLAGSHTCVSTAGGAKCWGFNNYGTLGSGSTTRSTVPVDVLPQ